MNALTSIAKSGYKDLRIAFNSHAVAGATNAWTEYLANGPYDVVQHVVRAVTIENPRVPRPLRSCENSFLWFPALGNSAGNAPGAPYLNSLGAPLSVLVTVAPGAYTAVTLASTMTGMVNNGIDLTRFVDAGDGATYNVFALSGNDYPTPTLAVAAQFNGTNYTVIADGSNDSGVSFACPNSIGPVLGFAPSFSSGDLSNAPVASPSAARQFLVAAGPIAYLRCGALSRDVAVATGGSGAQAMLPITDGVTVTWTDNSKRQYYEAPHGNPDLASIDFAVVDGLGNPLQCDGVQCEVEVVYGIKN